MSAGFEPEAFWQQTPRLYLAAMRAVRGRLRREADQKIALAWHLAALMRQPKLPPLDKLLSAPQRLQRPVRQSRAEMDVMFTILAARCGGVRREA